MKENTRSILTVVVRRRRRRTMVRRTAEDGDTDERLIEAQARIETLEAAAADAEARAATARTELAATKEARSNAEAQLAETAAAREAAEGETSRLRSDVEEARSRLSEAAVKYRAAKLAASPDVPADLVPETESLAEIDEGFEAAQRVVGQLRERMAEERQAARVPVGSPVRRAPDLSALPAAEKIKLGLREMAEREGR
jgi:chromosome segregation ATPase